ncbi:hypothetical protein, partial [Streptodolium elevatio]
MRGGSHAGSSWYDKNGVSEADAAAALVPAAGLVTLSPETVANSRLLTRLVDAAFPTPGRRLPGMVNTTVVGWTKAGP